MNKALLLLGFLLSFHLFALAPAAASWFPDQCAVYNATDDTCLQTVQEYGFPTATPVRTVIDFDRVASVNYADYPVMVSTVVPVNWDIRWLGLSASTLSRSSNFIITQYNTLTGYEEVIPSQIDYVGTVCDDSGYSVKCSPSHKVVRYFEVWYTHDGNSDDKYHMYLLDSIDNPTTWQLNSTHADKGVHDYISNYPARTSYYAPTNLLDMNTTDIDFAADFQVTQGMEGSGSGYISGDVFKCISPTDVYVNGILNPTGLIEGTLFTELTLVDCNMMGQGVETGSLTFKAFPDQLLLEYNPTTFTTVNEFSFFDVNGGSFDVCGAFACAGSPTFISPGIREYQYENDLGYYDYTATAGGEWKSVSPDDLTGNFEFDERGTYHGECGGGGQWNTPFNIAFGLHVLEDTWDDYMNNTNTTEGRDYTYNACEGINDRVRPDSFVKLYGANPHGQDLLKYVIGFAYTNGWASPTTFIGVAEAESKEWFRIFSKTSNDFDTECVDTSWTVLCDSGTGNIVNRSNCGNDNTLMSCSAEACEVNSYGCTLCNGASVPGEYQASGFTDYTIYNYCTNGVHYQATACGGATQITCDWGCLGNECAEGNSANFVNITWGVWDWHQGLTAMPMSGVEVSVTGTVYGSGAAFSDSCTTYELTGGGSECSMAIPKGSYQVTGDCTGEGSCQTLEPFDASCILYDNQEGQTGVNTWSMFNADDNSYCSLIVSNGEYTGGQYFSILESGVSENYTVLYVTAINNLEHRLEGVNVTVQINSTYSESQLTGATGQAQFSFTENDYDLGVTATKDGYVSWSGETHVIQGGIAENHLIVLMINEADMEVQGSGPQNAVVGTGLFGIDDVIPIPISFDKAGSVSIRRTDVRVFKCKSSLWDIIPFISSILSCNEFEMLKVAVPYLPLDDNGDIVTLIINNATEYEGSLTYAALGELLKNDQCTYTQDSTGAPSPGETGMVEIYCDGIDNDLIRRYTGGDLPGTTSDIRVPVHDFSKQRIGEHTHGPAAPALAVGRAAVNDVQNQLEKSGHPKLGLFVSNMFGIVEIGAKFVKAGMDMYTYDVIFQLDSHALIENIPNWAETTSVIIDGQYITGTYSEILAHPKYRRYIARRDPPPVLMLGDPNLMGEDVSFQSYADRTLDFDLETMEWSKDLIRRDVDAGIEYIRVKRDELFGDVQNDLINGEYDSLRFNENLLGNSIFEANAYLEVVLTPYDGSDPSTVYVLVPGYIKNYTFSWFSGGTLILILALIVLLGPIIISLLAIFKPRIGG